MVKLPAAAGDWCALSSYTTTTLCDYEKQSELEYGGPRPFSGRVDQQGMLRGDPTR